MADLTPQERLQPALLDRLRDDDPSKTVEARESRVMTRSQLRQAVLRDLEWLFNATRMTGIDWDLYPAAEHSVINFGLPALSGALAASMDVIELESAIRQMIVDFEPRITASTLQVEAIVSDVQLDHHNVVSVQIRGEMWAQPVPLEFLLRTDLDLETGQVQVRDLA